jgi:hypothetical protein
MCTIKTVSVVSTGALYEEAVQVLKHKQPCHADFVFINFLLGPMGGDCLGKGFIAMCEVVRAITCHFMSPSHHRICTCGSHTHTCTHTHTSTCTYLLLACTHTQTNNHIHTQVHAHSHLWTPTHIHKANLYPELSFLALTFTSVHASESSIRYI